MMPGALPNTRRKRHVYTLNGQRISVKGLARVAGLGEMTVLRRLHNGEAPEAIVADPRPAKGCVVLHGQRITLSELARQAGIHALSARHRLNAGLTPEQVVAFGAQRFRDLKKILLVNGRPTTAKSLARDMGVHQSTVLNRLASGMSVDVLMTTPKWHKGRMHDLNGTSVTTKDIAEKAGVSIATVLSDLRRGVSPAQIVQHGERRRGRRVAVFGESMTVAQLSELSGVRIATIKHRLDRGYAAETAAFTTTRPWTRKA